MAGHSRYSRQSWSREKRDNANRYQASNGLSNMRFTNGPLSGRGGRFNIAKSSSQGLMMAGAAIAFDTAMRMVAAWS